MCSDVAHLNTKLCLFSQLHVSEVGMIFCIYSLTTKIESVCTDIKEENPAGIENQTKDQAREGMPCACFYNHSNHLSSVTSVSEALMRKEKHREV